jgi:hypothetical protein
MKHEKQENETKISAFAIFTKERHNALKRARPELTVTGRAQVMANQRNAMSKLDKIPFINAAKPEARSVRHGIDEEDRANAADRAWS